MGRYGVGTTDDAWDVLSTAFPQDWREAAKDTGALKGLRKDKGVDNLLRTLLLHTGLGCSLRETTLRAEWAHLAGLSPVAQRNRVQKSAGWLHELCARLFEEQRLAVPPEGASQVRAVDAATVKERGRSGSRWRVHFSVSLPSLACDFFKVTKPEGPGTEKSLAQFPIRAGDHVLAGRGYATPQGIRHVADAGGWLIVPVDTAPLTLKTAAGQLFDLAVEVTSGTRGAAVHSWAVAVEVPGDDGGSSCEIAGRVWALHESPEAIRQAHEQDRRDAAREGNQVQPAKLRLAEYEIVFTTFPDPLFSAEHVRAWYHLHYQVEVMFWYITKLAQFGRVPKSDPDSSRAWLYGKLFMALLLKKLTRASGEPAGDVFKLVERAIHPPPGGRRSRTQEPTYLDEYLEWLHDLRAFMSQCSPPVAPAAAVGPDEGGRRRRPPPRRSPTDD